MKIFKNLARRTKQAASKIWEAAKHSAAFKRLVYLGIAVKACTLMNLGAGLFLDYDYQDVKLAENINEYFTHLAGDTASMYEFHRVLPLQMALTESGYECGPVDGLYGSKVRGCVAAFQEEVDLPADGIAGRQTFDSLRVAVNRDSVVENRLDSLILEPFRSQKIMAFMDDLGSSFNKYSVLGTLFIPHLEAVGGYYLFTHGARPTVVDTLDIGRNFQVADAYRHFETTYKMSRLTGAWAAEQSGNFRERVQGGPLPSVLMDMYNHKAAGNAWRAEPYFSGRTAKDVLVEHMQAGNMVTQPFPLIPVRDEHPKQPG